MDYLDFEFHYKGEQFLLNFLHENITDKLEVEGVTLWSGYVEFDNEKRYFNEIWFGCIIVLITEILKEKETFIKLSLQCKTRIYKEFINGLP